MPNAIPSKATLALSPPAIADALLSAGGVLHGALLVPFTFALADASVIFTVPAGYRMQIVDAMWEVTTSFAGGASSAIGLKSSNAAFNTAGDLLGGTVGDVAALLVSTGNKFVRTIGTKCVQPAATATTGVVVLNAGDTIIFNRITSAFTSGVGNIHIFYRLIPSV